jgi:ubiquinone/menaquinone biosynthesis C-methylase UbiE
VTRLEALDLLQPAHISAGETWADLGAGAGTFSNALVALVSADGTVHAVDKDKHALTQLKQSSPSVLTHHQDFTAPLHLKNLDGILMANALHFVRRQEKLLRELPTYLKADGKVVMIEYDIARANPWVPFPILFEKLKELAARAGLNEPVKVATRPSRYHREMYVAVITLKSSS